MLFYKDEHRSEGVMWVSGGRGKVKCKGPGAGQALLCWRKKQKPEWLEQRAEGGAVGVEVRQVSGDSIRQRLRAVGGL